MDEVKEQVAEIIFNEDMLEFKELSENYPAKSLAYHKATQIHELYKAKFKEEIEKLKNPIGTDIMYGHDARFSYEHLVQRQHDAWERCRQEVINIVSPTQRFSG